MGKFAKQLAMLVAVFFLCAACQFLPELKSSPWQTVQLPSEATVLDVSFASRSHGWLVGTHTTLMETFDGGSNWEPRELALDGIDYRLTSVSFQGDEGWIAGEPSILLHTLDGGQSWSRVSLSAKLPGSPLMIVATGPQSAELTTDVGAIYETQDEGRHWKALVQEAFGVARNIKRADDGSYVAVSSRGSFYSVWHPGMTAWEPHNRNSSRRIQSMGFDPQGHLWMLVRGGQVQFSSGNADIEESWLDPINPQASVSVGLLDLAYRTPSEVWVSGGSGNLLCSFDGGQTWQKDGSVANVPSNLYKILFFAPDQGFITGQDGALLRYVGGVAQSA
ncbi:photosynthesis system II assembly factor Ycf48 [Synechococcales cyanobacterium C]|uniref:Photosystem II assembly protein Ycf48 n=1 Tax=Petrachloros mirabilis ULC683 TaxID=2781853 RepID=A0A8K1ZXK9_9CYAN|nr:photosynthesis system II assembly factor Ycf48 [Petrachloros mirabilis]NCJ05861.1 photosynthesis system II assembly factor Ycf48 [Petrachloros mirabilis ULC683]